AFVPEPLDPTSDQIGPIVAQGDLRRLAQPDSDIGVGYKDELADVSRRLHQPKSVLDLSQGEYAVRQRTDFIIEQRRGDLGQQPAGEIRPADRQLIDVYRKVRDVLPERTQVNASVKIKIAFSEF